MEKSNDLSNDKIRILKRLKNIGQEMTEEDKTEQNGRNDSGNLESSPSSSKIGISNINAITKGEVDSEDSESHSLTSSLEFLHKEFDRNSNYSKRTPKLQENLKYISENSNQSNETVIRRIKSYLSKSNLDSKKKQKLFQNLFLTFKNLLEEEKNKETSDKQYNDGTENQSLKLEDGNANSVINKPVNILQAEENRISSTFESKEWCKQSSGNEVKLKNLMNLEKHNLTKPKLPQRKKFDRNNYNSENSESSSDTAKNQETVVYKNSELSVLPVLKQPTPFYHIGKNILSIDTETVPSVYGNKGKNLKSVILKIEPTDADDNSQPVRIEVSQVSPEEKNFKNSSIGNVLAPFTKEDTNVILLPSENRDLTQEMDDTKHVPLNNYKYVSKQSSTIFPINKILASGGLTKKPTVIAISATEDLQERKISENGSTILIVPPLREFQNLNVEDSSQQKWVKMAKKIAETLPPSGKEQPMIVVLPSDNKCDDFEEIVQSLVFTSSLSEQIQEGETIHDFSYTNASTELPTVVVLPSKSQHTLVKINTENPRVPKVQKNYEYPLGSVSMDNFKDKRIAVEHPLMPINQKDPEYLVEAKHPGVRKMQKTPEHSSGSKNVNNPSSEDESVSFQDTKQNVSDPLSASLGFDSSGLPPLKIEIGRNVKGKKKPKGKLKSKFTDDTTYGEKLTEQYKWRMAMAAVEEGVEETIEDCLMVALNQKKDKREKLVERMAFPK